MINWLKARSESRRIATELYGSIVTGARQPTFFSELAVPDTLEGRFEMICIHMHILLTRLEAAGDPGRKLFRAVSEAFVTDMDDAHRELGASDLSVPRKVKAATGALLGRLKAYRVATLVEDKASLAQALARNVWPGGEQAAMDSGRAERLAIYVRKASAELASIPDRTLLSGNVSFPEAQSVLRLTNGADRRA